MMQDPTDTPVTENTLAGVALRMEASNHRFTAAVGRLVGEVAVDHQAPVTCSYCAEDDQRGRTDPCPALASAIEVTLAWLLEALDEVR